MVGDDKGRENLGDYGDFWGIFLIFLLLWIFLWGILGAARSTRSNSDFLGWGFWEHSEQLGALGFWRRWWGLGLGWGWR